MKERKGRGGGGGGGRRRRKLLTCFLRRVQVRFLLCFADVLFITYSLITEPIGYLC